MSSEWKEVALSEVCSVIKRGISPKYAEEGGVQVLNQRCIRGQRVSFLNARENDLTKKKIPEDRYVKSFDVLINSTGMGTLGRVAQLEEVDHPLTVDSHVTIVRLSNIEIDPLFFGWACKFNEKIFEAMGEGSTGQTELSRHRVGEVKISYPKEIQEQKRIAHILGTLDDKIELNRKMNQSLESMAQALFQSWFVDFDPVLDNALAAGNPIPEPLQKKAEKRNQAEVSNKLINTNSALAKLFPSTFVFNETLNKWIPEGWELGNITEYCSVIDGDRGKNYPSQKHLLDAGYCLFLNAGNVTDSGFNFENKLFIDEIRDDLLGKGKLQKGDVIMTTRGTVGNVSFFNKNIEFENVRINSGMLIFRAKEPLHSYFINALLTSKSFKISIKNYSSGSAQPQLPIRDLKQIPVLKADYLIRDAFSKSIMSMQNKKDAQNQMNRVLSLHRDTLLPKLISGKIKILRILLTNGLI
jgi:type I restriction enzyme S subunit